MANNTVNDKNTKAGSIFRHWYWLWIGSGFFVAVMVGYLFFPSIKWLRGGYRGLSLAHEMSYAVWWSGMGLLTTGIIFARVGSLVQPGKGSRWVWFVISAAMVALSLDEIGSFHEAVATMAGWFGLLPFGIIFSLAFGTAWFTLIRRRETRLVAVLIIVGFCGFVSVAGLEYIEHNVRKPIFWAYVRWIVEEAVELISMGILITAGLVGIKSIGDADVRFKSVTQVVEKISDFPRSVTAAFIFQVIITAKLFMPEFAFFTAGNPASLFPVILFFCLGVLALQQTSHRQEKKFWLLQSILFFLTSILQMYNFNIFVNYAAKIDIQWFIGLPGSWLITMVSFLTLYVYALRAGYIPWKLSLIYLSLFFTVFLIADPFYWFIEWREYLYFLFSSAIAYFSYLLMRQIMLERTMQYDRFDCVSFVKRIIEYRFVWLLLLVIHSVFVGAVVAPSYFDYDDYPAALFPLVLFFCIGVVCSTQAIGARSSLIWLLLAAVFFFISALQLDSFAALVSAITRVSINSVTIISRSWVVLLFPLYLVCSWALLQRKISYKRIIAFIFVLLLVYGFVQPDLEFTQRIESHYFVFSGFVAYFCYLMVQDIRRTAV